MNIHSNLGKEGLSSYETCPISDIYITGYFSFCAGLI